MRIIDRVLERRPQSESEFALRFFCLSLTMFSVAALLAIGLIRYLGYAGTPGRVGMPPAFWITTVALLVGSGALHRALASVRTERQVPFRRALSVALASGTIFAGVQIYALWCLLRNLEPDSAIGAGAFIFALAAMHGLHFTVALLFLAFVTLHAFAGRYDHEYYWGAMVCTFFWHALSWVWICILAVFACAALTGSISTGPLPVEQSAHYGPSTGSGSGTWSRTCISTSNRDSSAMWALR